MPKIGGIIFPKVITAKTPGAMNIEIYDYVTGEIITREYAVSKWFCTTKIALCQKITRGKKLELVFCEMESRYFPNAKLRIKT